jgi:hypothetical protein
MLLDLIEKKYVKQLPHILGAITLCVVSILLALSLFAVRASRPVAAPISDGPVLVVFERGEGGECNDCYKFRKTIGRDYSNTATASLVPLRYYDISDDSPPPRRYGLAGGVGVGPTAVVFDVFGREAARWAGLPGSVDAFESFVKPHLRRAQRDLAAAASNARTTH